MAYANYNQPEKVVKAAPQFLIPGQLIGLCGRNHQFSVVSGPVGAINTSFPPAFSRRQVLFPVSRPPPPQHLIIPIRLTVDPSALVRMDEERSLALLQFMANAGIMPSPEEELKRKNVIEKLEQVVFTWIKRVAWQRRFPKEYIRATCATILTFGSYGLGVHGLESDIDALCIGPYFATMAEDFFIVLRNMLKSRPEVSEIHCIKDAKVPLMRFKFDGISIDLPYAQLKVPSVPQNLDILNPFLLRDIDETSWKSLSGVRVNYCILQLVPNLEGFQSMLRCIKLWARRRGVYGNSFGFLGGVHLAILAAFVCRRNPNASLNALISTFFRTFALWRWPTPVKLHEGMLPLGGDSIETRSLMPIQLPCSPYEYCHSNITRSTSYKIRAEFLRGHAFTKDLLCSDFDWNHLFDHFPYTNKYGRFVKIYLSAPNEDDLGDWVGWVKSRFRFLLTKLEEAKGLCDPSPREYSSPDASELNIVFYWGLLPGRNDFTDIQSVELDFMKNVNNGYQGPTGKMELSIVQASELPKDSQSEPGRETKACWKIPDYSRKAIPIYSEHHENYLVGYMATGGEIDYPPPPGPAIQFF